MQHSRITFILQYAVRCGSSLPYLTWYQRSLICITCTYCAHNKNPTKRLLSAKNALIFFFSSYVFLYYINKTEKKGRRCHDLDQLPFRFHAVELISALVLYLLIYLREWQIGYHQHIHFCPWICQQTSGSVCKADTAKADRNRSSAKMRTGTLYKPQNRA